MDRDTLMAHEPYWSEEPELHDLARLTAPESALYADLRDNRISPRLRLDQERVSRRCARSRVALASCKGARSIASNQARPALGIGPLLRQVR